MHQGVKDVVRGSLDDYDLANVLEVVSIGRQYVGVEVTGPDGARAVTYTKAGRVLAAEAKEGRGRRAFQAMFDSDRFTEFRVFRVATPAAMPTPIGTVAQLLEELHDRPTAKRVGTIPPPSATATPYPQNKHVVGIASPKGGVGKTTIALNLSFALARAGHRVALVDGDINGDILSAINARKRAKHGAYDVLFRNGELRDCTLDTTSDGLVVVPACGESPPPPEELMADLSSAWRSLFAILLRDRDIVVLDMPAGTYGASYSLLKACSEVVGVLQAESIAHRSFDMFHKTIDRIDAPFRPRVAGVVLNMLQVAEDASIEVLRDAGSDLPEDTLFEVTIPYNPLFLQASHAGLPLGLLPNLPSVTWLFDSLAGELASRLDVDSRQSDLPQTFLR